MQTRQKNDFFVPQASLSLFQKGVYSSGVKIFNRLPTDLKKLLDSPKQFKMAVKRYLISHCFYTMDEFFSIN
jgi:hypothetical protein